MRNINPISATFMMSLLTVLIKKAEAEHVLPMFTGQWFDGYHFQYVEADACGIEIFEYGPLASSPQELLEWNAPYHSDCVWDFSVDMSAVDYKNSTNIPAGFVSTNHNDWNIILESPNAALTTTYYTYCYNESSMFFTDSMTLTMYPLYSCSSNTRLSYDNTTSEIGCTTTPMLCVADAVARDLAIEELANYGHIGLVTTNQERNPTILEVLNEKHKRAGIYLDPMYGANSFTTKSLYWGARNGVEVYPRLPFSIASSIIETGKDQEEYCARFHYTVGWDYYPANVEDNFFKRECKFRCDSFVYYCYDANGIKLQSSFAPMTFPNQIFSDFLCSADPVQTCPPEYSITRKANVSSPSLQRIYDAEDTSETRYPITSLSFKMLEQLDHAFESRADQKKAIPRLLNEYQGANDSALEENFARYLCSKLRYISPEAVDQSIKPLLSTFLWQHSYLSEDNFLLSMIQGELSLYTDRLLCRWLSAYFTTVSDNQQSKEEGMIRYIDKQDDIVKKANLVTSSRLGLFKTLTKEKRCEYGRLFQKIYTQDKSLSERYKKILWLGLTEMKYPNSENLVQYSFCK